MRIGIFQTIQALWQIDVKERTKFFYLGAAFFSIIASYTITKELKDSLFMDIVGGQTFVPYAKLLTIFGLIPLVLLYGKLVDKVRRYQLLCYLSLIYSLIGFCSAIVISHGGLGNGTEIAPYSLYWFFGWIYFFYIESFSPFVVSVFWAFLNSVTTPENAKKNYGLLISLSKLGGMTTAGLAWFLLAFNDCPYGLGFSETKVHGLLMVISSLFLLTVPLIIWRMMRVVPGQYLHGYEAAYQFEKQQHKEGKDETGIWSGLSLLVKYPYVFGIFLTIFFYEAVSAVLSYLRLGIAQTVASDVSGVSCFLFQSVFYVHFIGFIISIFGTRILVSYLGERFSLLVMPIVLGSLLVYLFYADSAMGAIIAFIALRSIYYAFNQPVTEALYIPTVKDVKFKSKSWIDTFGKKLARGTGSTFNILVSASTASLYGIFFGVIISAWTVVAYLLGKRYSQAIENGEVIGAKESK